MDGGDAALVGSACVINSPLELKAESVLPKLHNNRLKDFPSRRKGLLSVGKNRYWVDKENSHSSPISHGRPLTFHVLQISYEQNKYAVITGWTPGPLKCASGLAGHIPASQVPPCVLCYSPHFLCQVFKRPCSLAWSLLEFSPCWCPRHPLRSIPEVTSSEASLTSTRPPLPCTPGTTILHSFVSMALKRQPSDHISILGFTVKHF